MKYVISRYNHDLSWLSDYTDDFVVYDRSDVVDKLPQAIKTKNVGSDIYDKFTFIIDNYTNLPDIAVYTKANIFKYITKEEFDIIKDNKTFTPILTKNHKAYSKNGIPICFYCDDIYWEINNGWYIDAHRLDDRRGLGTTYGELHNLLGIRELEYIPFAPGSNYIIPKENILKHSKEFYIKLRNYLEWSVYPGEAQIIERGLYLLWK